MGLFHSYSRPCSSDRRQTFDSRPCSSPGPFILHPGRAHYSSVHTDELPTSTHLSACARQAKLPERFPKSPVGVPTLSVCLHLDPLASLYDGLDVDSPAGEAPFFTKVVS